MSSVDGKVNTTDQRSRISQVIVVMLTAIPILAALAYGAVDTLAIGVLFILASLVVILWIVDALRAGEFSYSDDAIQLPLIGLILIACVQLLPLAGSPEPALPPLGVQATRALTADPYATRLFLIHLLVYLIVFSAGLVYLPGASRLKRIAFVIVVAGTLLAFFGILQRLSTPEAIYGLRETPQALSFGPFVNQHHFAALMQMTSGVALGMLFGSGISRERKIFVALGAGIMGMAVIFTGSRGGLIGYLSVVGFAAAASLVRKGSRKRDGGDRRIERRSRNLLILTAAGGLVVLVLGSVLFLGGRDPLLRGVGLQYMQEDLTSGRLHFWKIAWQIFLENPVIGSGMNGFGMAFTQFDTWNGRYRVEQAHNDYLQMLADAGILGFACVAVFVFLLLKKGVAAIAAQTDALQRSIIVGSLAGCTGILVHSFFDFPLRTPANAFFFLLLVALLVGNASVKPKRQRE